MTLLTSVLSDFLGTTRLTEINSFLERSAILFVSKAASIRGNLALYISHILLFSFCTIDLLFIYDFELAPYYLDNTGELQYDIPLCAFKREHAVIYHYRIDGAVAAALPTTDWKCLQSL